MADLKRAFADGDYTFALKYAAVAEYEKAEDKSLFATLRAALAGEWFLKDVREIIRLALIGGGTPPTDALRLVRDYVEARPLAENTTLFTDILAATFFGVDEIEAANG